MRSAVTIVILSAVLALSLTACGRKGNPVQPPDATYPRKYPEIPEPEVPVKPQQDPKAGGSQAPGEEAPVLQPRRRPIPSFDSNAPRANPEGQTQQ